MSNTIVLNNLIEALATDLTSLTWLGTDKTNNTSFSTVYTYFNIAEPINSPWACVVDSPPIVTKRAMGGLLYEKKTPIEVYIFTKYATSSELEAEIRLRDAYEAVEKRLTTKSVMDTVLAPGYSYQGWDFADNGELKVRGRKLKLEVQSII